MTAVRQGDDADVIRRTGNSLLGPAGTGLACNGSVLRNSAFDPAIAGFGLGLLAVSYRNEFLFAMRRLFKFELFPEKLYMFSKLSAVIVPQDVALICGASLVICILAGLLPALNAARLHPIDALRHE